MYQILSLLTHIPLELTVTIDNGFLLRGSKVLCLGILSPGTQRRKEAPGSQHFQEQTLANHADNLVINTHFLTPWAGQLQGLFHTSSQGSPVGLSPTFPRRNLFVSAPCTGFYLFPVSRSYFLTGASWDCLQNNLWHSTSCFRIKSVLNTILTV